MLTHALLPFFLTAGMYQGGAFLFSFTINTNYPHDPPKVKCTQKVIRKTLLWTSHKIKYHLDLPSERRSGRKRLLEHPPRRLETRFKP